VRYGKLVVESDGKRLIFATVGRYFISHLGGRTYACVLGGPECPPPHFAELVAESLPCARISHAAGAALVVEGIWASIVDVGGDVFAIADLGGGVLAAYLGDWNTAAGAAAALDWPQEVVGELVALASEGHPFKGA